MDVRVRGDKYVTSFTGEVRWHGMDATRRIPKPTEMPTKLSSR